MAVKEKVDRFGAADGAPAKFRRTASRSADRDGFDEASGAQARSGGAPTPSAP